MAKRPAQRGVTLVELLVTIILAAIFFAAAVPLFVFAQKQSSGDRARVIAANVAQSELEAVRSTLYAELDEGATTSTWPNDLGGPIKVYKVDREIAWVHQDVDDPDSAVLYKVVTVDVYWTPPPKPVKHVVYRTVIYPEYKGPDIDEMTVGPLTDVGTEKWLESLPVLVRARADLAQTAYVRFSVSATDGSYSDYRDVTLAEADAAGWFTWDAWEGVGAGDGVYAFNAVAVSAANRLGEYWYLRYRLETGPPDPPGLEASGVKAGDKVVSIQWKPPSPVAGDLHHYSVERSDGWSSGPLSKASTTFIDRTVTNGVTYSYTVRAYDDKYLLTNLYSESASVSCTPQVPADTSKPSPPTGLTALVVGQSVQLNWNKNSVAEGVDRYWVFRDDDAPRRSPIAVIVTDGSSSYSYTDQQIGWGVTHTYYVRAVNAALYESLEASTQSLTTAMAPPEQRFDLEVKVTGSSKATVMVASLASGVVYWTDGEPIVGDPQVNPIRVQNNGTTFNLPYGVYQVTVTFVDNGWRPLPPTTVPTPTRYKIVELAGNATVSLTY